MKLSSYYKFITESDGQSVLLDDGRGGHIFSTNKYGLKSIAELNAKILSFIKRTYFKFGYKYSINTDINADGLIINSEYISKMVNNYTVFKSIIRNFDIKNEDQFYSTIENNMDDIYGYKGKFFKKETLPILINTTRKGNIYEEKANNKLMDYCKSKGFNVEIIKPTTAEDISGIDSKFILNGNTYTVQIKPMISNKTIGDRIFIKTPGSVSINTNYLIAVSNTETIILRNSPKSPITIVGDEFISPTINIVSIYKN